jgi:hypothetical protein
MKIVFHSDDYLCDREFKNRLDILIGHHRNSKNKTDNVNNNGPIFKFEKNSKCSIF